MFRLVYMSHAVREKSADDVAELIYASGVNDKACGVSGLVLSHDGRFVHEIVGARSAVARAFAGLRRDPRHSEIELLEFGPDRVGAPFPDDRYDPFADLRDITLSLFHPAPRGVTG